MRSPFSARNWILFILINILISAATAFLMIRFLSQAASRPDPAVLSAPEAVATQVAVVAATATADLLPTQAQAVSETQPTAPAQITAVPNTLPTESLSTPTVVSAVSEAPAANAPTPAPAVTGPANVRISTVVFPGQRSREAVVIVNEGDQVDMTGWTLSTPRGQTFTFGSVLLFKESFINVHTSDGVDVPTDLFWNQQAAMWKKGDEATLKRGGEVVATFTVK